MTDGTSTQLAYGKYEFDDLLKLYANAARPYGPYANAVQPAVFDKETNTFTYLNPDDDDTLFCSFSTSGGRGVHVVGRSGIWDNSAYTLYYYDAAEQATARVFQEDGLLGSIVNIVYCTYP